MDSEVRLIIAKKEARLVLKYDDEIIEDDLWKFPDPILPRESKELARILFDEGFDMMQFAVHGD